jgi:hypothetical protein
MLAAKRFGEAQECIAKANSDADLRHQCFPLLARVQMDRARSECLSKVGTDREGALRCAVESDPAGHEVLERERCVNDARGDAMAIAKRVGGNVGGTAAAITGCLVGSLPAGGDLTTCLARSDGRFATMQKVA